ncbi:MAG: hypothetical protein EAZ06_10175 [Cytophagales bacterium]|nr:MAG: hypothetical protein EAZ06_10175 [Cytophagales bacterium]
MLTKVQKKNNLKMGMKLNNLKLINIMLLFLPFIIFILIYKSGFIDYIIFFSKIPKKIILVKVQVCTCPEFKVLKSNNFFSQSLINKNVDTTQIFILNENNPFYKIGLNYYDSTFIFEGIVAGKKKLNNVYYPIFKIHKWVASNKIIYLYTYEIQVSCLLVLLWVLLMIYKIKNFKYYDP